MRIILRVILLTFAILLPVAMVAQDQSAVTGSLNGTVTDPTGAAIPDATVTITGPQGTTTTRTDSVGRFTAANLNPGFYDVKASKTGFSTTVARHNEVTVSVASTLSLKMGVGSEATTVEVTAAAVALDTQNTAITSNLTDTFYNSVPMQRNVSAIFYAAPGVAGGQVNTTPNQTGPGAANPSIGGSSGLENLYVVDGVTITDQAFGSIGTYNRFHGSLGTGINLAFLKEVDVKTTAFEPQYGKALGGIVQMVTNSGGTHFHGAVAAYFQPAGLWAGRYQWQQFRWTNTTPYNTLSQPAYDAAIEFGGYIPPLKEKLFFFGAFNPSINRAIIAADPGGPGASAAPPQSLALGAISSNTQTLSYAAKITYKITDLTTLELTAFGDPSKHNVVPSTNVTQATLSTNAPATTESSWKFGSQDELARLDSAIRPWWTVDLSYAYNHNHFNEYPAFPNLYGISDQTLTYTGGAVVAEGVGPYEPSKNNTYSISANTTIVKRLYGQHAVTVGYSYDHTNFIDQPSRSGPLFPIPTFNYLGQPLDAKTQSGGLYNNYPAGADGKPTNGQFVVAAANAANAADATCTKCPVLNGYRVYASSNRGQYGGLYVNVAGRYHQAYGEDVYQMNRYVTLNLGVRWDNQRMTGPNQSYSYGASWSPRLGINIDPMGDGKGKVFFNFGRNFWAAPLDATIRELGGELDSYNFLYFPVVNADGTLTVITDQAHLLNGTPRSTTNGTVTKFRGPTFGANLESILPGTKQEYEDEYVIGVERSISNSVVLKGRYTDRRLPRIIEDVGTASPEGSGIDANAFGGITNVTASTDIGVNEKEVTYPTNATPPQQAALGCTAANNAGIFYNSFSQPVGGACILNYDVAGSTTGLPMPDGIPDGFAKPVRRYNAVEFEVDKRFSQHWLAVVNFKWGNLFGNYEGAYRNDNGQSDPGISSLFDFTQGQLGLLGDQFAPGPLSTDRRTVGNIFLSYNIGAGTPFVSALKGLTVGLGARGQSGVPLSRLGDHPIYLNAGEIPVGGRGAAGRTPSASQLDFHLDYGVPLTRVTENARLKLAFDMFNVTNSQFQTARNQNLQLNATSAGVPAQLNADYNRPTGFQQPFNARGSVRFEF